MLYLVIDTLINIVFLGDIFVNLLSAYQDKDLNVVDDLKVIYY